MREGGLRGFGVGDEMRWVWVEWELELEFVIEGFVVWEFESAVRG